ncbi:MAG: NAD(P)/FAD-dependent oxidoreductase [Clostridia bacterium]|nr:NAD(P)/FAD-dependent oxidoreductase [Clostridia bacterium]
MKNYDLIIIGGCASGLAAAINCKRLYPQKRIVILEKLSRIGKKILATGNGKCNLTNLEACSHAYRNKVFADFALNRYNPQKVIGFFESMGLICYADSCGRVYPESNTASSVLDALRFEAEKLEIEIKCDFPVSDIRKENGRFVVNGELCGEKIILATGGKASPSQGSDGSGYPLAKRLGHSLTSIHPALVPLTVSGEITKSLKGIRARDVELTLENGEVLRKSRGEILFTENGLSGIAAMELAADSEISINDVKKNTFTHIDFLPQYSENEVLNYLKKLCIIKNNMPLEHFLSGVLPKQLGIIICKASGVYKSERKAGSLTDGELKTISKAIKDFSLKVTGTKGFLNAQVTCGGVPVHEIDPETMQSKKCSGLYIAGEIADVDGACGGFNLQWAWASGMLAGELK